MNSKIQEIQEMLEKTYTVCKVKTDLDDIQTKNTHYVIGTKEEVEDCGYEVLDTFEARIGDEWYAHAIRQLVVETEELEESGNTEEDLEDYDVVDELGREFNPDDLEEAYMQECEEDYEGGITEVEDCGDWYYVFIDSTYCFTLDIDTRLSTTRPFITCTLIY